MSMRDLETPHHPRIKLVQSFNGIKPNNDQTYKKSPIIALNSSNLDKSPRETPKMLIDLNNQLKSLRMYYKKPRNLSTVDELKGKALNLIDQNNQLNSVLENDISLQYLESQDISPKRELKSLGNSKRDLIKANLELNKKLFHFFLEPYPEKIPANQTLELLQKELNQLNYFEKENLNFYQNSNSFLEVHSGAFLKIEENNSVYDKLVEDYNGLASENLTLKQGIKELEEKFRILIEENKILKNQNGKFLEDRENKDQQGKESKEMVLKRPKYSIIGEEQEKNEEFKLLDDKITQLLNENARLKQLNSEQEKMLETYVKGQRDSNIVVSQNHEKPFKSDEFCFEQTKQLREIKEREELFMKEYKNSSFLQKASKEMKESTHLRCNKVIEELKNELLESHLCIADLENKIKKFWVQKSNVGKEVTIKNYDVRVNFRDENEEME